MYCKINELVQIYFVKCCLISFVNYKNVLDKFLLQVLYCLLPRVIQLHRIKMNINKSYT